jgi:hypothetical protein
MADVTHACDRLSNFYAIAGNNSSQFNAVPGRTNLKCDIIEPASPIMP